MGSGKTRTRKRRIRAAYTETLLKAHGALQFFAPGVGAVAMIGQENATAFRIIHIDTSSGKVMMSR